MSRKLSTSVAAFPRLRRHTADSFKFWRQYRKRNGCRKAASAAAITPTLALARTADRRHPAAHRSILPGQAPTYHHREAGDLKRITWPAGHNFGHNAVIQWKGRAVRASLFACGNRRIISNR
jgi:hypothetical protein